MKNLDIRILVISHSEAEAEQIQDHLLDDFDQIFTITDESRFAIDFDACKPDVIVLAFKQLELAERCYLGLYRHSSTAHRHPHRTIVLCDKDNVRRAFELCRQAYLDDYVMYWPMVFDSTRLAMSIIIAARSLETARTALPGREMASHARQVANLERVLDSSITDGQSRLAALSRTLGEARSSLDSLPAAEDVETSLDLDIGDVPTGASALPVSPRAPTATITANKSLKDVRVRIVDAQQKVVPVAEWIGDLKGEFEPQLEAARKMRSLAEAVVPEVVVVDDDTFQCKLLAKLLESQRYKLHFTHSGCSAMALLARLKPALILMDVQLPDLNGVEITRRVKATRGLSDVPIIMITGRSERAILEASLDAGAIDFVVKPFERRTLLAKIARHIAAKN